MAIPLINGESYDWSQIVVTVAGSPKAECKAISYTATQEKTNNYGQGSSPTSRGRGRKTFEGSLTLSLADLEAVRDVSPNRDILDLPMFTITVTWIPLNGIPLNHVLKNVDFTEDALTVAEGDTDIAIELPFIFSHVEK